MILAGSFFVGNIQKVGRMFGGGINIIRLNSIDFGQTMLYNKYNKKTTAHRAGGNNYEIHS